MEPAESAPQALGPRVLPVQRIPLTPWGSVSYRRSQARANSDRVLRIPLDDGLRELRLLPRFPPIHAVPHAVPQRPTIRRLAAFERHWDADELRLEPASSHRDQPIPMPAEIYELEMRRHRRVVKVPRLGGARPRQRQRSPHTMQQRVVNRRDLAVLPGV